MYTDVVIRATLCVSAVFAVVRCPSVMLLDCIHTVKISSNFLFRPVTPPLLFFFNSRRRYPILKEPLQLGRKGAGKYWRFLTEITVYLRNGAIQPHRCYVTLIGSHGGGSIRVDSDDLEGPLTQISRSRYLSKLNISKTAFLGQSYSRFQRPFSRLTWVSQFTRMSPFWILLELWR